MKLIRQVRFALEAGIKLLKLLQIKGLLAVASSPFKKTGLGKYSSGGNL